MCVDYYLIKLNKDGTKVEDYLLNSDLLPGVYSRIEIQEWYEKSTCRMDWNHLPFEEVEKIAELLTDFTDIKMIAVEFPDQKIRKDIVKAPAPGMLAHAISPDGKKIDCEYIANVTPDFEKVTTSNGVVFLRQEKTNVWKSGKFTLEAID